jgi:hypothetical protein
MKNTQTIQSVKIKNTEYKVTHAQSIAGVKNYCLQGPKGGQYVLSLNKSGALLLDKNFRTLATNVAYTAS